MGCDANLYISKNQFSSNTAMFDMFKKTIDEEFGNQITELRMVDDCHGGYWILYWHDQVNKRQLNIHTDANVGGFPAILLSLGSGDNSDKLLEAIGRKMGGLFTSNDCGPEFNFKEFQDPMHGNEEWLLKQIKAGIKVSENIESLVEHLKKKK